MSAFLASVAHDLPGLFADLGRVVTYAPAAGVAHDLLAIVGERTEPVELGQLTTDGPQVWIRVIATQVPDIAQGDGVTIGDAIYRIDGLEFDRGGTVMATLIRDP